MFFKLALINVKKHIWTLLLLSAEIFILVFALSTAFADLAKGDAYVVADGKLDDGYVIKPNGTDDLSVNRLLEIADGAEIGFVYSKDDVGFLSGNGNDIPVSFKAVSLNLAVSYDFSATEGGFEGIGEDACMLAPKWKRRYRIGDILTLETPMRSFSLRVCGFLDRFGTTPFARTECLVAAEFTPQDNATSAFLFNGENVGRFSDFSTYKFESGTRENYEKPQLALAVCVIICAMALSGVAGVALVNLPKFKKQGQTEIVLGCTRGCLAAVCAAEKAAAYIVAAAVAGIVIACLYSSMVFPAVIFADFAKAAAIAFAVCVLIAATEIVASVRLKTISERNGR